MPQNRRSRPRRRNNNRKNNVVATKLDTLVDLQKTQVHGSVPLVRDVPRIRMKRNKVYTFVRSYPNFVLSAPASAPDYLNAMNFTLSALPSSTEFTALFDQYRIVQVTVRFLPLAGVGSGSSPLITAIDYDDSSTPVAVTDLLQYDSHVMTQPGVTLERTFTPRVSTAVYSGTFTSFASAPNSLWIDVASPNTQYYGLKLAVAAASGSTANWNVLSEYVMQFRNVR